MRIGLTAVVGNTGRLFVTTNGNDTDAVGIGGGSSDFRVAFDSRCVCAAGSRWLRVTMDGETRENALSVDGGAAFVFFPGGEQTLDNSHFQGAISYELDGGSSGTVAAGETDSVQIRGFTSISSSEWQSGSYYDPSTWYTEPTETPPVTVTVDDSEIPAGLTGISFSELVFYLTTSNSYCVPFSKATVENQSGRDIASIESIESDGWTYSATIADGDSVLIPDLDASTELIGLNMGSEDYWVVGDSSRGGALSSIEDGEIDRFDGTTVSTMSGGQIRSFLGPVGSYGSSSVFIDQGETINIRNAGTILITDSSTTSVTVN